MNKIFGNGVGKSKAQYTKLYLKSQRAFTLIELIITLLVGSLLLAWGIPNYRDLKNSHEMSSFANEMLYSFAQARAEAIRRGINVQVTRNGGWGNGWIVQAVDADGNLVADIAVQESIASGLNLSYTGDDPTSFAFNNLGALTAANPAIFDLTNPYDAGLSRRVIISLSGSTRVTKP